MCKQWYELISFRVFKSSSLLLCIETEAGFILSTVGKNKKSIQITSLSSTWSASSLNSDSTGHKKYCTKGQTRKCDQISKIRLDLKQKKKHQNKKIQKIFIEWTFFIARASIKNSLIFLCLYSQGSSERNSENQLNFFKIWTCLWQRGILHFTTFHPRMDSKILPSTQIWKWYSSSWVSLPF